MTPNLLSAVGLGPTMAAPFTLNPFRWVGFGPAETVVVAGATVVPLLVVAVVSTVLYVLSLVWVWRDARRHGWPPVVATLLVALVFWPAGLVLWWLVRDQGVGARQAWDNLRRPASRPATPEPGSASRPAAAHDGLTARLQVTPSDPPAGRGCPRCGRPLRPDAPDGLCPACLLRQGLAGAADSAADSAPTRHFVPPAPADLAAHFPRLEIVGFLGRGGMGAVYKARQTALDRFVALKILAPQAAADPGFTERFAREARALARLDHPNIVAVHESGQSGGFHYLIMEYVDGTSLRQVLRSGGLEPAQALQIVPEICSALQYAHDQGVVHRDIKPENILLDRAGHVRIADFGLAKLASRNGDALTLTDPKQVMGTPHYMAPEQVEKPQTVDHRADIYSLGVVFYEMLTGELPLGRFQPPSSKVQMDVRLDEVVLKTLEKEPERRYQHASQVKTDVEGIAAVASAAPFPGPGAAAAVAASGAVPPNARLSRTAVIGLAWALTLPLAALPLVLLLTGVRVESSPGAVQLGLFGLAMAAASVVLGLVGLSAPVGATACGCVALSQIRHSQGRLCGLGLALLDALLYPLLLADLIIVSVLGGLGILVFRFAGVALWLVLPLAVALPIVVVAVDVLIAWAAWRAATRPVAGPPPAAPLAGHAAGTEAAGAPPSAARRWRWWCLAALAVVLLPLAALYLFTERTVRVLAPDVVEVRLPAAAVFPRVSPFLDAQGWGKVTDDSPTPSSRVFRAERPDGRRLHLWVKWTDRDVFVMALDPATGQPVPLAAEFARRLALDLPGRQPAWPWSHADAWWPARARARLEALRAQVMQAAVAAERIRGAEPVAVEAADRTAARAEVLRPPPELRYLAWQDEHADGSALPLAWRADGTPAADADDLANLRLVSQARLDLSSTANVRDAKVLQLWLTHPAVDAQTAVSVEWRDRDDTAPLPGCLPGVASGVQPAGEPGTPGQTGWLAMAVAIRPDGLEALRRADGLAALRVSYAVGGWSLCGSPILTDAKAGLVLDEHTRVGAVGADAAGRAVVSVVRTGAAGDEPPVQAMLEALMRGGGQSRRARSASGSPGTVDETFEFSVPLAEVTAFQYLTRPQHRVVLRDVHVRLPGIGNAGQ